MKLKTKEDIGAPIEYVFGAVSDFETFQRQALRRGAEVARLDTLDQPGVGVAWDIAFGFRGKRRQVQIELIEYEPPTRMLFDSRMTGMTGQLSVELMALSKTRTRLILELELVPENLSARLLVQSLKLARGAIDKRAQVRVADWAKGVEDRYTKMV